MQGSIQSCWKRADPALQGVASAHAPGVTGELLNNTTRKDESRSFWLCMWVAGWRKDDDKRWRGRQAFLAVKEKGITLLKLS